MSPLDQTLLVDLAIPCIQWNCSPVSLIPLFSVLSVYLSVCLYRSLCLCVCVSLFLSVCVLLSLCLYVYMPVCMSVCLSLCLCLSVWPYIIILTCPSLLKFIFSLPPSLPPCLPSPPQPRNWFSPWKICLSSAPPLNCPLNSSNTSQDDAAPYGSVSRCVNWCLLPWRLIQFCIRVLLYLLLSVAVATNTVCLYVVQFVSIMLLCQLGVCCCGN